MIGKLGWFLLAGALSGAAQDQLAVPISNPSQPVMVKVHLLTGSITVTGGGKASEVLVESVKRTGRIRSATDVPEGMKRIDTGGGNFDAEEDHNVVTIGPGRMWGGNISIVVPTNASLQLKSVAGGKVSVTGVNGDLEIENVNGAIELSNVSGSVVASSQNGAIRADFDKVAPGKPMSFTTMNGRIDVTLPGETKAKLRLKTENGSAYSDFDVKLEPDTSKPAVEDARGQGGKYRIRMDRSVYGTINGGGPEYRFETMNGSILIHKK